MKKISIIVPMYNSFHMMSRNLEVLEKQKAAEIELIIVDDCSSDDSFERATAYAQSSKFDVIVAKNEKNGGPGVSRNLGLTYATGDYITFVDSDDYFSNDFSDVLAPLLEDNIECIIFDYLMVDENGEELCAGRSMAGDIPRDTFIDHKDACVYVHGSPWGKIYRKDVVQQHNVRFGEFYRNEDMPFTKCAVAMASRVYHSSAQLYRYVQVSTSLMHNHSLLDERNCMRAFDMISERLSGLGFEEELRAIELREVLNNTVLIKLQKREKRAAIIEFIKQRYTKKHIKNRYFSRYGISTKIITYCAFFRALILLRLILAIKNKFKKQ